MALSYMMIQKFNNCSDVASNVCGKNCDLFNDLKIYGEKADSLKEDQSNGSPDYLSARLRACQTASLLACPPSILLYTVINSFSLASITASTFLMKSSCAL
jgi:hypothetical protein